MEKTENEVSLYQSSLGEAAVDGLFGGVIAGLAMAVILLVAGLLEGRGLLRITLGHFGRHDTRAHPRPVQPPGGFRGVRDHFRFGG